MEKKTIVWQSNAKNAYEKDEVILNFFFGSLVFLFFIFDFLSVLNPHKDGLINISFLVIGVVSILELLFSKKFISLKKMFFAFIFIFFYFTAFKQYSNDEHLWNHVTIGKETYLQANVLIIMTCVVVILIDKLNIKYKAIDYKKENSDIKFSKKSIIIISTINLMIILYFILINGVISREGESTDTIASFIQKTIRFFPVATLMAYLRYANNKNNFEGKSFLVINSIISLILFFPFAGAISRFLLFSAYLALIAKFISNIKYRSLFPLFILIFLCVVFPLFNFFKSHSIMNISEFVYLDYSFDYSSVDYDAYQMFLESIVYSNTNTFLYGQNVISSILFFVPRSLWSHKLLPSGTLIAMNYGADFTNLSCPFIAEFYLSFGVIGVIIGSFLIGLIIKYFDYWFFSKSIKKIGYSSIIIGMSIYWLRGSLLPTTAYLFSLVLSYYLLIKLIKIF